MVDMDAFWAKVEKTEGGCWLWKGAKSAAGYGVVSVKGRHVGAHRIALMSEHGPDSLPPGMQCCHRCNVRLCVNPAHLYPGTPQENNAQTTRDNRMSVGPGHPGSKLDQDAVREIRMKGDTLEGRARLMLKYGVSECAIIAVYQRKMWKHVPDL